MRTPPVFVRSALIAALAVSAVCAPLAARAQDLPSYAVPATVSTDETVHGRITSVDGAFSISVADDRGFIDHVQLHPGTIINPTGLSLSPGMSVTIAGYNAGSSFDANEIDTPYSYSGPLPEPVYYGPGYWCPGFGYGYGPSFSLAFIFGGDNRFEHRPFYGRPWDGHRYFGGYVGRESGGRDGGHEYGGRAGGHDDGARNGGERRGFGGEARANEAHVPSAFAGRAFAGHVYEGPGPASPYAERRFDGQRGFAERAGHPASSVVGNGVNAGFAARGGAAPGVIRSGGNPGFAARSGENAGAVRAGGGPPARGGGGAAAHGGGGVHH